MSIPGKISIWFFIGILLAFYGALIFGHGIYELVAGILPNVVLARLHAPVWWGAMMLAIGLFYCIRFAPGRKLTS
jgi:xanthine/uracil permease